MKAMNVQALGKMKRAGQKIAMVTAYDQLFAGLADEAGIDVILVGDSLGMVVQGRPTTLGVTLDEMIYHTRCVMARPRRCLVVGDLPFGSYQASVEQAVDSACRMMAEAGCGAVKLEGGEEFADRVAGIAAAGVPVMGHVGLTPQSIHKFGGYKLQGRNAASAREIARGARALQDAGAFSVVLEKVHAQVAARISGALEIPSIGIGSGPLCDGQVLVLHDLLGLFEEFQPRFVKRYARLAGEIREALSTYATEIRGGIFPGPEHSYGFGGGAAADAGADTEPPAGEIENEGSPAG